MASEASCTMTAMSPSALNLKSFMEETRSRERAGAGKRYLVGRGVPDAPGIVSSMQAAGPEVPPYHEATGAVTGFRA